MHYSSVSTSCPSGGLRISPAISRGGARSCPRRWCCAQRGTGEWSRPAKSGVDVFVVIPAGGSSTPPRYTAAGSISLGSSSSILILSIPICAPILSCRGMIDVCPLVRNRDDVEICSEALEGGLHLGAPHGLAMAGDDEVGF